MSVIVKRMRALAAAAILPALSACDVVSSTHPVGLEPVAVEAEEWEGTWITGDGAFTLRVPEGAAGRVELGWIEEEDDRLVLKTCRVDLRSASDWIFASLEHEEETGSGPPGSGPPGSGLPGSGLPGSGLPGSGLPGSGLPGSGPAESARYLWGRLVKDEGKILFWLPSVDKVRQLVEEGALPGTVEEGGDVVLAKLEAEHLALIASGERGVLFEWDAPMILRRLED